MPTYQQVLKDSERLARLRRLEPSAVKLLLLHFSKMSASELFLHMQDEFPEVQYTEFKKGLHRYLDGFEPVQYIIGYVYFYGYQFLVGPNVLIPRFETEELVANVLIAYDEVFGDKEVRLVDVGTGSGCLAIALALEEPHVEVSASDVSLEALSTAKQNASNLGANVTFYHGDMLQPLMGQKFDILVSNPPYIPEDEAVDPLISNNEPHVALYGGKDGLKFYRIILSQANELLNDTFVIAFEHAYNTAEAIRELALHYFPQASVETLQDMQHKDRMTLIKQIKKTSL
jgi:release factor glutamine methyltransferase